MSAVDETAGALADVARALVRAAGEELLGELRREAHGAGALRSVIDEIRREATSWKTHGLTPETDSETEDQCADAVLGIIERNGL